MTTRQRLDLLARAYPRLFPRAVLLRLLRAELGHADALDRWVVRDGTRVRAQAPKLIYHICAGNLAVSAWTSIAHGLLLGSANVVKLPSDRDHSTTRREILDFIRGLPAPLRRLVTTHRQLEPGLLRRADAVVAFGSDATMASLRAQTRWDQRFIAHGHAVSLLWLADPGRLTSRQARACATDILAYDQLGCLSPQSIFLQSTQSTEPTQPTKPMQPTKVAQELARALETTWQRIERKPARPLGIAARIAEARDVAHALGHRVWLPPGKHLGWTLIHDPDPIFQPSPLHGVIYLREVTESGLPRALSSVAGRISTIGVAGQLNSRLEKVFLSLGVSRFCSAGRMQFPPLTWHHDGRSSLGDLVTWVDAENLE